MTAIIDGSLGITAPTYNGTVTAEYSVPVTAFKNRIINGAMVIDQRNAGSSGTSSSYTVDRFGYYATQSSKVTWQQNAGSVTPPAGFKNYLGFTSSSAYSVISSDIFELYQSIEGYNIADLGWGASGASSVTLSFWVRSSLTGTFGGSLTNNANTRNYPFTYTINSANTWEQKNITVTGDTTGTWATTNSVGLNVIFSLGTGSTYNTSSINAWNGTSGAIFPTGATSVVGTNGATFYITGVQLEKGSTATSFDYRPYGQELILCQRYYAKLSALASNAYAAFGSGMWFTNTTSNIYVKYPVAMRSAPTISYGGNAAVSYGAGSLANIASANSTYGGTDSALWQPVTAGVGTAGQAGVVMANNDATAFIALTSEL